MTKNPNPPDQNQISELLILGDGSIFVHNLTPMMAGLLSELNPHDEAMRLRAKTVTPPLISVNETHQTGHPCAS
jgi:hypothetical protein